MKTYKISYYFILILMVISACNKDDYNTPFPFAINKPPVALAGNDRVYDHIPDVVTLTGEGKDPEGLIYSYSWRIISGPPNANIILNDGPIGIFKFPDYGEYVLAFEVTDKGGLKGRDTVKVTIFDPTNDPCLGCWDY